MEVLDARARPRTTRRQDRSASRTNVCVAGLQTAQRLADHGGGYVAREDGGHPAARGLAPTSARWSRQLRRRDLAGIDPSGRTRTPGSWRAAAGGSDGRACQRRAPIELTATTSAAGAPVRARCCWTPTRWPRMVGTRRHRVIVQPGRRVRAIRASVGDDGLAADVTVGDVERCSATAPGWRSGCASSVSTEAPATRPNDLGASTRTVGDADLRSRATAAGTQPRRHTPDRTRAVLGASGRRWHRTRR